MKDEVSVLLKLIEEERSQGRQSENQRATITNLIVTISAGLIALITNKGFSRDVLALGILLMVLGVYGMISSSKLYERWCLHRKRAGAYQDKISKILPELGIRELKAQAHADHKKEHRFLYRIRLNFLWIFFHLCIFIAGVVCTYVICTK